MLEAQAWITAGKTNTSSQKPPYRAITPSLVMAFAENVERRLAGAERTWKPEAFEK
jgi:hypothetical protein